MTKSQNTKNEQQKDLCITYDNIDSRGVWHWRNSGDKEITSEQLTEQWKKEHSIKEYQHYYIKDTRDNIYIDYFWGDGWLDNSNEDIAEVLSPVPSYNEWLEKTKSLKVLAEEYCKEKEENTQLKSEYKAECHRADELEDSYWKAEKENAKLKELLKECREEIEKHIPKKWHGEKDETMQKYRNKRELRTKIDEALK